MARVISGRITGKVGDLIFSNRNGVNYVRRASKKTPKTPTLKQLIQREKFGMVMHFLSPIKGLLNESCRHPKKSGMTIVAKQILAEAIIGEYPDLKINFSLVSLIRGNLRKPDLDILYNSKSGKLHLSWQYSINFESYLNDELCTLIYCPSIAKRWHYLRGGILRSEQNGAVKLPAELIGHDIHIWLFYHSEMMGSFSDTEYVGQVCTQKPGDDEND